MTEFDNCVAKYHSFFSENYYFEELFVLIVTV